MNYEGRGKKENHYYNAKLILKISNIQKKKLWNNGKSQAIFCTNPVFEPIT